MRVGEWNALIEHAQKICAQLDERGYCVTTRIYSTFNDGKGIELRVHDCLGGVHKIYASGSSNCYTPAEMRTNLDDCAARILREC